ESDTVLSGVGAGRSDFLVRLRRLRRTRIYVSRLRRTIHLPPRSVWRSGRVSLRMDAVRGGKWWYHRGALGRIGSLHGQHHSRHLAGARDFLVAGGTFHARKLRAESPWDSAPAS